MAISSIFTSHSLFNPLTSGCSLSHYNESVLWKVFRGLQVTSSQSLSFLTSHLCICSSKPLNWNTSHLASTVLPSALLLQATKGSHLQSSDSTSFYGLSSLDMLSISLTSAIIYVDDSQSISGSDLSTHVSTSLLDNFTWMSFRHLHLNVYDTQFVIFSFKTVPLP